MWISHWADCKTLPLDHTYDHDLSRSKFEIALSQKWEDWLACYERDVKHLFMTVTLIFVWPWLVWVDVPDSDLGDFICPPVVNISSCPNIYVGEDRGGSGPPTPGVHPPYPHPFFSSLPLPPFFLTFFSRVPPPKIQIFCHLPPAHFSSKAPPTPASLPPGPPSHLSSPT